MRILDAWTLVALLALTMCLVCCRSDDSASPIRGKWRTGTVATEWGDGELFFEFEQDRLKVAFVPKVGSTIRNSARYELRDGTIVSEALNSGLPMRYAIREGELFLTETDSTIYRLRRK